MFEQTFNNCLCLNGSPFPFQVSGLEMRKWMDELFPIIMDMLQDSSSLAKRQVREALLHLTFILVPS